MSMTHAPVRMFLRSAWYSAIAVTAFMAIGVELDRQGRADRWATNLVPDSFRSDTLENLTRQSFKRGDSVQGEALARRLVERRPISAEPLSLYGYFLLVNGKLAAGEAVLQVAESRGWRDRFVQRVAILSALQQSTPQIAANRVVGLWRIGERDDWLHDLTRATLKAPGGLSAFENALIPRDKYFGTDFLVWATANLPFANVDRLAKRMAVLQSEFNCSMFSGEIDKLVRYGNYRSAAVVWKALCESNRSSTNELAFGHPNVLTGPSDWRYPEVAGVDVDLQQKIGRVILHYSSSNPLNKVIARRYLAIGSGHYVLKVDETSTLSAPEWHLMCISPDGHKAALKLDSVGYGKWSFDVQATCPVQELGIVVRNGSGDIGQVQLYRMDK